MKSFVIAVFFTLLAVIYLNAIDALRSEEELIKAHVGGSSIKSFVSFQKNNVHKCSGALITDRIVLGLYHCIKKLLYEPLTDVHVVLNLASINGPNLLNSIAVRRRLNLNSDIDLVLLHDRVSTWNSISIARMYTGVLNHTTDAVAVGRYQACAVTSCASFGGFTITANSMLTAYCPEIWVSHNLYVQLRDNCLPKGYLTNSGTLLFREEFLLGICWNENVYKDLVCVNLVKHGKDVIIMSKFWEEELAIFGDKISDKET